MCNVSPDYGHKDFHVCMLEDVEKIPTDIEKLFYHPREIINFSFGQNLRHLCLSENYTHPLDFLENTQVTTLSFPDNITTNLLNNIPNTIHTLQLTTLSRPLINIPSTVKKINIYYEPVKDLLLNSKIPHDCEVFYGRHKQKYIV